MENKTIEDYIANLPNIEQVEIKIYSQKLLLCIQIELFRTRNKLKKKDMAKILGIGTSDYSKLINGNKRIETVLTQYLKLGLYFKLQLHFQ